MAVIEEELRSAILANSAVNALVGARVYANELAPLNAELPFIVYDFKDTVPDPSSFSLDGPGLYRSQFALSCRGERWTSSRAVADVLRSALENKTGAITTQQSVEYIFLKGFTDQGFQADLQCYLYLLEIEIVHN